MGWKLIPSTPEQEKARNFNLDLMQRQVNYPLLDIAELTPLQQEIMAGLQNIYGQTQKSSSLAREELTKTLTDQYDPRTSDYYKGLRDEYAEAKKSGQTALRQRANLGGMLYSTPAMAVEAASNRQFDTNLLKELGTMYERERDRRGQAARNIQGIESQNISNVAGISQMADQKRQLEQYRNDALYNQAIQNLLFPYQYQSGIAQGLINEPRYMYKSKNKSSGLAGALGGVAASFAGSEAGSQMIAGGIGGLLSFL